MSISLAVRRGTVRLVLSALVALLAASCTGPMVAGQASASAATAQRAPDDPTVMVVARALEQRLDMMVAAAQAEAKQ